MAGESSPASITSTNPIALFCLIAIVNLPAAETPSETYTMIHDERCVIVQRFLQSFGVPLLEFVPGQNPPIELDMTQIEDAIVSAYES